VPIRHLLLTASLVAVSGCVWTNGSNPEETALEGNVPVLVAGAGGPGGAAGSSSSSGGSAGGGSAVSDTTLGAALNQTGGIVGGGVPGGAGLGAGGTGEPGTGAFATLGADAGAGGGP
jgi:hypothetical protein